MPIRRRVALAGLVVPVLIAVGCGTDGDDTAVFAGQEAPAEAEAGDQQPSSIRLEPDETMRRVLSEEQLAAWTNEQQRLVVVSESLGFPSTVSDLLALGQDVQGQPAALNGQVVRASDGTPVLCPPGGPDSGRLSACINNTSIQLGGNLDVVSDREDGAQVVVIGSLVGSRDTPYSGYPWLLAVESVSDNPDATATECNYDGQPADPNAADVFATDAYSAEDVERAFNEELLGQVQDGEGQLELFEFINRESAYFTIGAANEAVATDMATRLGRPVHLATYGHLGEGC